MEVFTLSTMLAVDRVKSCLTPALSQDFKKSLSEPSNIQGVPKKRRDV